MSEHTREIEAAIGGIIQATRDLEVSRRFHGQATIEADEMSLEDAKNALRAAIRQWQASAEPAPPVVMNQRIELLAQHLFRQYEGDRPKWEGIEGWERVHWRNAAAECLGIGLGIAVEAALDADAPGGG